MMVVGMETLRIAIVASYLRDSTLGPADQQLPLAPVVMRPFGRRSCPTGPAFGQGTHTLRVNGIACCGREG